LTAPAVALDDRAQAGGKAVPVCIVKKDAGAVIAPRCDVVQSAGELNAEGRTRETIFSNKSIIQVMNLSVDHIMYYWY
jgi:hypothetical protein